jgi:hypothetical protein
VVTLVHPSSTGVHRSSDQTLTLLLFKIIESIALLAKYYHHKFKEDKMDGAWSTDGRR